MLLTGDLEETLGRWNRMTKPLRIIQDTTKNSDLTYRTFIMLRYFDNLTYSNLAYCFFFCKTAIGLKYLLLESRTTRFNQYVGHKTLIRLINKSNNKVLWSDIGLLNKSALCALLEPN